MTEILARVTATPDVEEVKFWAEIPNPNDPETLATIARGEPVASTLDELVWHIRDGGNRILEVDYTNQRVLIGEYVKGKECC